MTFLYPLGLLGLIGVPLLILIYILRSKYNEQTVPSTYLWTLSEKFFRWYTIVTDKWISQAKNLTAVSRISKLLRITNH